MHQAGGPWQLWPASMAATATNDDFPCWASPPNRRLIELELTPSQSC